MKREKKESRQPARTWLIACTAKYALPQTINTYPLRHRSPRGTSYRPIWAKHIGIQEIQGHPWKGMASRAAKIQKSTSNGEMKTTGTETYNPPHRRSSWSLAHRHILILRGRIKKFRPNFPRTAQKSEFSKLRKSRRYLQVPRTYLQVPTGTLKENPAGDIHLPTLRFQHICSTTAGIIGDMHYRNPGPLAKWDEGTEHHNDAAGGASE